VSDLHLSSPTRKTDSRLTHRHLPSCNLYFMQQQAQCTKKSPQNRQNRAPLPPPLLSLETPMPERHTGAVATSHHIYAKCIKILGREDVDNGYQGKLSTRLTTACHFTSNSPCVCSTCTFPCSLIALIQALEEKGVPG
jgi:hypothetical protein